MWNKGHRGNISHQDLRGSVFQLQSFSKVMKNDIEGREESFLAGQIKKNNLGKDLVFSRLKKR